MSKRGQTATEYIVIFAVVMVLVTFSATIFFDFDTQNQEMKGFLESADIGTISYSVSPYEAVLVLTNNRQEQMRVDNISVDNEKKNIRKCRNSEHHALLIGWLQDEVVGYLVFRSNMWQRLRSAGEFAFSVSKKNWGLGIGSHIMGALLDWARKSKVIKTIELRVSSDNKRAIAVYRKLGFTPKRSLLWKPFDHIVMKLTLP